MTGLFICPSHILFYFYFMKKTLFVVLLALGSCQPKGYGPDEYLTPGEQDAIMWSIIRYIGRPPEGSSFQNLFSAEFDDYYQEQQSFHRLDAFFIKGDTSFFLISRRAPSLEDKRVTTGGKLIIGDGGKITYYEEIFRTYKMKEEELKVKGNFLFDLMVKNGDLTRYQRVNNSEEYIEFPDPINYYDVKDRKWKIREAPTN